MIDGVDGGERVSVVDYRLLSSRQLFSFTFSLSSDYAYCSLYGLRTGWLLKD